MKVSRLKPYIKFHGLTFEEMLFELKRVIYENSIDDLAISDSDSDMADIPASHRVPALDGQT